MNNSLDDLFKQILNTELKAQERKQWLKEVQSQIEQSKEHAKQIHAERENIRGRILVRLQRLCDEEAQLKWEKAKVAILKEQIQTLQEQHSQLQSQQDKLKNDQERQRENFTKTVEDFFKDYGIGANRQVCRETQARQQLDNLKQETLQLEQELTSLCENGKAACLKNRISELEAQCKQELELHKVLDQSVKDGTLKVASLEHQRDHVATTPHNDAEFKRWQSELVTGHSSRLEEKCRTLQLELERLKERLWQHHLQAEGSSEWEYLNYMQTQEFQQPQSAAPPVAQGHNPKRFNWKKTSAQILPTASVQSVPQNVPECQVEGGSAWKPQAGKPKLDRIVDAVRNQNKEQ